MSARGKEEREPITWQQLEAEAGALIAALCRVRLALRQLELRPEEHVALKVAALTSGCDDAAVAAVRERYLGALGAWLGREAERRLAALVGALGGVREAAALLLHSKMFYVPFLLSTHVGHNGH